MEKSEFLPLSVYATAVSCAPTAQKGKTGGNLVAVIDKTGENMVT